MNSWLAGLGQSFLAGSDLIGRNRQEKQRLDSEAADREARNVQLALQKRQADQSELAFNHNRAKDMLEVAGPNGMVDASAADAIRAAGMGGRLQEQEAQLPSTQFTMGVMPGDVSQVLSPGQTAGTSVLPTATQASELEERARLARQNSLKEKYLGAIQSPQFATLPVSEQQKLWTLAGMPGQAPRTGQQLLDDQRPLLDYQQGLDMAKIRAQGENARPKIDIRNVPSQGPNGQPGNKVITFVNGIPTSERWEPANPSAGALGGMAESDAALGSLANLQTLFKPEFVGPIAGRAGEAGQQIPGVDVNPAAADFYAASASFRNQVIKAITGAAVGVQEANRIMSEIPLPADKPEVWAAKHRQSVANLERLKSAKQQVYGMNTAGGNQPLQNVVPPPAAQTPPPAGGGKFTITRLTPAGQ